MGEFRNGGHSVSFYEEASVREQRAISKHGGALSKHSLSVTVCFFVMLRLDRKILVNRLLSLVVAGNKSHHSHLEVIQICWGTSSNLVN